LRESKISFKGDTEIRIDYLGQILGKDLRKVQELGVGDIGLKSDVFLLLNFLNLIIIIEKVFFFSKK